LVDDVDAFQKLAPRLQRLGSAGRVGFKIGGDPAKPHHVAVGLKLVRLVAQRLADLHQRLAKAAAGLLGAPVRPQPLLQPPP
jgi:hypothetical protein